MTASPAERGEGGSRHSIWRDAAVRLWAGPLARACLVVIAIYACLSLAGEGIYHWHQARGTVPAYQKTDLDRQYLPPGFVRAWGAESAGEAWRTLRQHPLGTDGLGRDVARRLIQGARIAFQVGVVTSLIAIPIGLVLGLIGGYFGGRLDAGIVWLYSTFASIPGLLLILAIAMVVGKGLLGVYLGIGLTTWVGLCRLVRGEVIKHRGQTYVTAARVLGLGHARILFRHILPNVVHIVIINFTYRFPAAINTEVILSFLGLGAQGEPSWGRMINSARLRLWHGVWWELAFVTLAIVLIVLAFNLLGDKLRDALDPRLREG